VRLQDSLRRRSFSSAGRCSKTGYSNASWSPTASSPFACPPLARPGWTSSPPAPWSPSASRPWR